MKKKFMLFLTCLFIGIGLANAQVTRVTGNVTSSEDGMPVTGASVLVKGTNVGTITDIDGNFTIANVPSNGTVLVVSFIGMQTQEVPIKETVRVMLRPDSELLDEVVVTAMGISKEKKALGYAVQDVKSDKLMQGMSTDLAGAISGKVSGLNISSSSGMPGASSHITIRGARSFDGDNTPLYVVDGMPVSSGGRDTGSSVTGADYGPATDTTPVFLELKRKAG